MVTTFIASQKDGGIEDSEAALIRACHLSGQMSAEQSVQHYREGTLQQADAEDKDSNAALLFLAAVFGAIAAAAFLWLIFQPFFK